MLTGTKQRLRALVMPVARAMARLGVSPDALTGIGLVTAACAGVSIALGRPTLGALWLLLNALCDILDGDVARLTRSHASRFGAFFDSTSDRVSEAFIFGGLLIGKSLHGAGADWVWMLVWLLAFTGSLLVSYARARAEGLGLSCSVGIADRTLRMVIVLIMLFTGYRRSGAFLAGLAGLAWFTVGQRVVHVGRLARQRDRELQTPAPGSAPRREESRG
jgi:CDP-diacylglycerol---glycerol-3-phosphate 3-phosphatidyltransferase